MNCYPDRAGDCTATHGLRSQPTNDIIFDPAILSTMTRYPRGSVFQGVGLKHYEAISRWTRRRGGAPSSWFGIISAIVCVVCPFEMRILCFGSSTSIGLNRHNSKEFTTALYQVIQCLSREGNVQAPSYSMSALKRDLANVLQLVL